MWYVAIIILVAIALLYLIRSIARYFTILDTIEPLHREYKGEGALKFEVSETTIVGPSKPQELTDEANRKEHKAA